MLLAFNLSTQDERGASSDDAAGRGKPMDFGALPPEINSARIHAGPGSPPLLAAATAWDGLATELYAMAASYGSVISELRTGWHGPSSLVMAAAVAPYAAWLASTAATAEQAAFQAKAAAGAYEAVFAATVAPAVIGANRASLASLVATNILGQNTPAIAAAEAQYAAMWAQDAAAMYSYAGASALATQLTSFGPPPMITDQGGASDQVAAVAAATQSSASSNAETVLTQAISQVPATLQGVVATGAAESTPAIAFGLSEATGIFKTFNNAFGTLAGPYTPIGLLDLSKNWYQAFVTLPLMGIRIDQFGSFLAPKPALAGLAPLAAGNPLVGSTALPSMGGGTVSAVAGQAGTIGSLTVPMNWAASVPAIRTAAFELQVTSLDGAPAVAANARQGMFGPSVLASLAGRNMSGTANRAVAAAVPSVPGAVPIDNIATTSTIIVIPPNVTR